MNVIPHAICAIEKISPVLLSSNYIAAINKKNRSQYKESFFS